MCEFPSKRPTGPYERYRCMLCGRDRFTSPGQPHVCNGNFRKRFRRVAKLRGIENAFVRVDSDGG